MTQPSNQETPDQVSRREQGKRIGAVEAELSKWTGMSKVAAGIFGLFSATILTIFINSYTTVTTLVNETKVIKETTSEYRKYAIDLTRENAELKNRLIVLEVQLINHEKSDAERRSVKP